MSQITQSKIKIYEFPDDVGCSNSTSNGTSNPEDEKERRENRKLKERVPFAVVGSNTLIDSPDGGEKKIRGRRYPWGIVDVSTNLKLDVTYFLVGKKRNLLIGVPTKTQLGNSVENISLENTRMLVPF